MDKIKQNEKGGNSILNVISVTLSSILSAITSGTNALLTNIKELITGANSGTTNCTQITTNPQLLIPVNGSKKGVIIANNQNTSVYIGFDSMVNSDCFVFHLRPAENPNEPQDYVLIEKEEYYGEIWAVASANPTLGTVNTTILSA